MLQPNNCPLTGLPADTAPTADGMIVANSVLGFTYSISRTADAVLENKSPEQKDKICSWLIDRFLSGEKIPNITSIVLSKIENSFSFSLPVTAKFSRLMQVIASITGSLGSRTLLHISYETGSDDSTKYFRLFKQACIWTECKNYNELNIFIEQALKEEYIIKSGSYVVITYKGWEYIENNNRQFKASSQAFVAMWFNVEMNRLYDEAIEPAIREMGFEPKRIDRHEHINKIDDEIIAEIRRSRFIIADFTSGSVQGAGGETHNIPRGGVYYEAGFAQGLGIPVIWSCKENQLEHLHFDTRQYNHLPWDDVNKFKEDLKNRIGAVIGDGPLKQ